MQEFSAIKVSQHQPPLHRKNSKRHTETPDGDSVQNLEDSYLSKPHIGADPKCHPIWIELYNWFYLNTDLILTITMETHKGTIFDK